LHTVRTFIPTVTEPAFVGFLKDRIALEIGAGKIVEQHFKAGTEKVLPALAQMTEELLLGDERNAQFQRIRRVGSSGLADTFGLGSACPGNWGILGAYRKICVWVTT
jgi:hypothetical protein